MTARTKLNVLDRAHTVLVLVLGSAAAITALTLLAKPATVPAQFAQMAASLSLGYVTAFLTDTLIGSLVRGLRTRLQADIRNTDPAA